MSAPFDLKDDSVVVVIGSGAGGGTLGNELAQKGINVVILEAGARYEIPDFINDEWAAFQQLAWKDERTTSGSWRIAQDFPNLPSWIVKAVGGTSIHWAGASLRIQDHEFKTQTVYGNVAGATLLDWPITRAELDPYYDKAEYKMGVTGTNGIPRLPGNNNYQVLAAGAKNLGYQTYLPATWPSIRSRATAGGLASKSAFVLRVANPAPNGRLCTRKSRPVKPPAIWKSGRIRR
jgi:choline dehydrogenase-like flavoprotein